MLLDKVAVVVVSEVPTEETFKVWRQRFTFTSVSTKVVHSLHTGWKIVGL